MTLLVSTGFKTGLLGGTGFVPMLRNGAIEIFTGARPASPDTVPPSSPIAMVTNLGLPWAPNSIAYGLNLIHNGAYISGDPSQTWLIVPNAFATLGPATWWRMVAPLDTGMPSLTEVRMDGDIGLKSAPAGEEILLDSTTLVPGVSIPFTAFFYTI